MKKIAALIVMAAFVATPAAAIAKKRHPKPTPAGPHQMTPAEAMAYNKRNLSLIVQGLPLILPSWSLPIYFGMKKHNDQEKHGRKKH